MIFDTLTSPIILFFALGMFAGFARPDLVIPEAFAKGMAIYLMAAIGLKGGVEVSRSGISDALLLAGAAGVALSFLLPLPAFAALRGFGRLGRTDAAAVAAHYGSASYIAVPAAMRLALPEADPGIYLAMSLGITFPFNIVVNIALIASVARMIG